MALAEPRTARGVDGSVSSDSPDALFEEGGSFLQIRGISMRYSGRGAGVLALSDVNLSFGRGSFVCVIGPSGCGKTTLLQMVGGFVEPSSGQILLNGLPIRGPSKDRGIVFQQPALFPWMNVYRNAEFGPKLRNVSKAVRAERVEHYLRMVGLWEFRDAYTYQLSGGMQQRLAIVRALINDPEMLLADEPFGALDAFTRDQMQEELHSVWQATKMTVMFVTHSVEEAVYLGTHVVVMSHRPGRVLGVVEPPFAWEADRTNGRAIKASADFVEMREQVLSQILTDPDTSLPSAR